MFEWHADLTGKENSSLNSENIVDWIWFNFTLKIAERCYECQPQNDFAVSKLWLDRPDNVKLKVFCIDFVAMATSLENLSNMFEIGNHKKTHYSSNRFEGMVHITEVMGEGEFVQFWLSNLQFRCHGDLRCKFEQDIWNHRSWSFQQILKYWICSVYELSFYQIYV